MEVQDERRRPARITAPVDTNRHGASRIAVEDFLSPIHLATHPSCGHVSVFAGRSNVCIAQTS